MSSPQANIGPNLFSVDAANALPSSANSYPFVSPPLASASSVTPAISITIAEDQTAKPQTELKSAVSVPPNISLDFDSLYLALSCATSRPDAMVKMVEWLAKALPGINVRCGLGTSRLRRFFDARLGWLGAESNLQRELAARWSEFNQANAKSSFTESQITIRLGRTRHANFALLCLSGERVSSVLYQQIHQHEAVLSSILWNRPVVAIPDWSATRGRPRLAIAIAGLMFMLLLVWPCPYRTTCTVRVEPVGARVVSAPFEATLESVSVEPGDEVIAGQPLVVLDGRPLRLEQQSIDAEIQQATKQQDVAIAAGKIAEAQLSQFKCQQLRRQRELIERRLGQLHIVSPINGVIVAGDLQHSVGVPLEIGQILFEVAPLDRVIIEVEIPEREIGLVQEDSAVQVRVDSARVGTVDAVLSKIYPSAQLRDDQSVFVAPIEIENQSRQYRPGMRGKATTYGPIRPWAWSYLRGIFEQTTWLLGI
jgi:Barrel-sandwich domain of CusB or HlyD membrane-fusion